MSDHQLRATGRVRYAYLGISSSAISRAAGRRVRPGHAARGVGADRHRRQSRRRGGHPPGATSARSIQDQPYQTGGDVIVAVDGTRIREEDDLSDALSGKKPGNTFKPTVIRDGGRKVVAVEHDERPLAAPSRPDLRRGGENDERGGHVAAPSIETCAPG